MKKEAIDKGCRYSIALDEEGYLAEGSTENAGILSSDGMLKFPSFEKTLEGITVKRVFELAQTLRTDNIIKDVRFAKISPEEAYLSSEMMLLGTSISVLPVVSLDGRPIGKGSPGPVSSSLSSLLWKDMTENKDLLTDIEWGF
jgi:branched-chain amino acid aminotransferase